MIVYPRPEMYSDWREWAAALVQALETEELEAHCIPHVDKAQPAERDNRGRIFLERNPAGDVVRVCIWNGAAFQWIQIAP